MKITAKIMVCSIMCLLAMPALAPAQFRYRPEARREFAYRAGYEDGFRDGLRPGGYAYRFYHWFNFRSREYNQARARHRSGFRYQGDYKKGYRDGYRAGYSNGFRGYFRGCR